MKLEELGGYFVAGGAGVVGLDEHVVERERGEVGRDGWRGVCHGGEATGARRRRRERRRRCVVRPLRVAEDLSDGYAGPAAGPMSSTMIEHPMV